MMVAVPDWEGCIGGIVCVCVCVRCGFFIWADCGVQQGKSAGRYSWVVSHPACVLKGGQERYLFFLKCQKIAAAVFLRCRRCNLM